MSRVQLRALNDAVRADPAALIARCDAQYDRRVARAAGRVLENLAKSPIVLLAGPSASGKTTTARRLRLCLEAAGVRAHQISLDDYYRDPQDPAQPRTADGSPDWEAPESLDLPLLLRQLDDLAAGRPAALPRFDFQLRRRDPDAARILRLGQDEAVILEGLHALHPMFTRRQPHAFPIAVCAATDLYDGERPLLGRAAARLLRRCVRDFYHRAAPFQETLGLWRGVRRGEARYIRPCCAGALALDTALDYELPVLAQAAMPQLLALPSDAPEPALTAALRRAAALLAPLDPRLVPGTSLLKEEFLL